MFQLSQKPFRALPPAGGFVGCSQIFKALGGLKKEKNLTSLFPEHFVYLVNSGKSALHLYFLASIQQSKSKEVALAGYTCPDVAVAAINAGYKIRLLDVEPNSTKLKIDFERVKDVEAVLLSNLYGLVDEVEDSLDVVIIDDACQAALSFRDGQAVGVSNDKIGVFSLGRGKAYSASGGGLLLIPKNMADLNSGVLNIYSAWERESLSASIFKLLKCAVYSFLENPYLYRLVVLIPFLKLGETKVEFIFPNLRAGLGTKILFFAALLLRNKKSEISKKLKHLYEERLPKEYHFALGNLGNGHRDENLIRFPIAVSETVKSKMSTQGAIRDRAIKLGITGSYPLTLRDYFRGEHFPEDSENIPNAIKLSKSLLTLPIGQYVTKKDINEIVEFLEQIENGKIG